MKLRVALIAAASIIPVSLMAQEEPESPWSGNATLGYLATSGNTETSTLNTGFEVGYTRGAVGAHCQCYRNQRIRE